MSKEILINVTPQETRVAMLVGNIYKGRVCRVLPGMEAAFVEVGMERAAFLHVSDIAPHGENAKKPSISHLLTEFNGSYYHSFPLPCLYAQF